MASSKATLRSYFNTGDRPTQGQFFEWIDAYIHKRQDGLYLDENGSLLVGHTQLQDTAQNPTLSNGIRLQVDGAIQIGSNPSGTNPPLGALRWNIAVGDFQGKVGPNPNDWISMTGRNIDIPEAVWDFNAGNNRATLNGSAVINGSSLEIDTSSVAVPGVSFRIRGNRPIVSLDDLEKDIQWRIETEQPFNPADGPSRFSIYFQRLNPFEGPFRMMEIDQAGNVFAQGSFQDLSDARLKKDISEFSDGLEKLMKLNPIRYKYNGKAGTIEGREKIGLIAQDVQALFPFMVEKRKTKVDDEDIELLSIDSSSLQYILINAIKELGDRISKLESNAK